MCPASPDLSMASGRLSHISATALAVRKVADALDAFCTRERLPEDVAWRLGVAVDEIVANIVMHAPAGVTPAIDVDFSHEGDLVEITISDDGPPFDPFSHPPPDLDRPLETREPGGLGIVLIRGLMDEVGYTGGGKNVVTLRIRLRPNTIDGGHSVS